MELQSAQNNLISHILGQMIESCELIRTWNESIAEADDYPTFPIGTEIMAVSFRLIEAIDEEKKKIYKKKNRH